MRESRLFRILYHLLENGCATAPELAGLLEVSVRTVYRDIDALSSAGVPVYATAGRNGGVKLMDHYVLNKSLFTDIEKQEILAGLQSLYAVRYADDGSALKKLRALFQKNLTDWIDVDFTRWGSMAERENELFGRLRQAIFEKRLVRFDYLNASGFFTGREAMPKKLYYKDKSWYLHAFCLLRNDYRFFRLTRIQNLVVTGLHFEEESLPPPEDGGAFEPQPEDFGSPVDIELFFSAGVGYRLYDILDADAITRHDNGFLVRLTLPENDWLYDFLMSFGDKATVLRPASLHNTILEKYEAALKHYTKNPSCIP